jgi:hypothetical protein
VALCLSRAVHPLSTPPLTPMLSQSCPPCQEAPAVEIHTFWGFEKPHPSLTLKFWEKKCQDGFYPICPRLAKSPQPVCPGPWS